jgi:arylamine N-acetyltransferase
MIALFSEADGLLPGTDSDEFLANWIGYGAGGTCWPSSNGLFAIVRACGFDACRATGSMFMLGKDNHGTVIVQLDGVDWVVDSSMLTMMPFPLSSSRVFIHRDPPFRVEVEPAVDGCIAWWAHSANPSLIPCKMLDPNVPHSLYSANYERSRKISPFNERLFARRNFDGRIRTLVGPRLIVATASEVKERDLSADELLAELTGPFGYDPDLIDQWVACGALESTLKEGGSSRFPPIDRLPPSERSATN